MDQLRSQTTRSSRDRFFEMLAQAPRVAELWDQEQNVIREDAFERALGVMSSGEIQMALFFAAIWFNDNKRYGFDVVDAVARVDEEHRKLIAQWILNPFWP